MQLYHKYNPPCHALQFKRLSSWEAEARAEGPGSALVPRTTLTRARTILRSAAAQLAAGCRKALGAAGGGITADSYRALRCLLVQRMKLHGVDEVMRHLNFVNVCEQVSSIGWVRSCHIVQS